MSGWTTPRTSILDAIGISAERVAKIRLGGLEQSNEGLQEGKSRRKDQKNRSLRRESKRKSTAYEFANAVPSGHGGSGGGGNYSSGCR